LAYPSVRVVWDAAKDASNRRKHGVSFERASALLVGDIPRLEVYDDEHSSSENRFFVIGAVGTEILAVVYSEPEDDLVRLISARRASRREVQRFLDYARGVKR
jgi:uncharacterized DUF497 family protein